MKNMDSQLKEIIYYILFGVCTTLVNILTFQILVILKYDYKLANVVAFIISIVFAYITNKIYVFKSKTNTIGQLIFEFIKFSIARILTFFIDFFGLIVLIEMVKMDKLFSKIIVNIIVIILNYFLSKKKIFVNKNR